MIYTRKRGMKDAQDAISSYTSQIDQLNQQMVQINSSLDEIMKDMGDTRLNLAHGLLTDISEQSVGGIAQEVGAIHLPGELKKCHKENVRNQARIDEIAGTEEFINSESLIHPIVGKLTADEKEYQQIIASFNESILRWEQAPHFLWIKKDIHRGSSFFDKVVDAISFAWVGRGRKYAKCEAVVGELITAFNDYDDKKVELDNIQSLNTDLSCRITAIKELVKEHETLSEIVTNFESIALDSLHTTLASHFYSADLGLMKDSIRKEAIPMLAKLEALRKKKQHLSDQKESCKNEISDRENRRYKVESVLMKWRRSSRFALSSNKSNWLVDIPNNCQNRTNRFCSSYASQRDIIVQYQDYNSFSKLFITGMMFSSFAVFASGHQVDNYVVNQVYSEVPELADMPEDMVLDAAAASTVMNESVEMLNEDAVDVAILEMEQGDEGFEDAS
ncbi:hypothetical protein [Photobacterium nomapromontoriensis]|uniref:hypothetical protein n=1 Tax=Photobacterium nomapromontoriensis TaxID=2910237 RepID=UPI003D0C3FE9